MFFPIIKAFGECLLPAKQSGKFQPRIPRATLVDRMEFGYFSAGMLCLV